MNIPVYRHNQDHDDWEVASLYGSDSCNSMGRSACNESVYSSGSLDDPVLHMECHLYDDTRPLVRYSVPPQHTQHQNYPLVPSSRPRWDARYAPGKQSDSFVVPPPGVIFPSKDRPLAPPQDTYWPTPLGQITSPPNVGLVEPPPSSLLLSPSSPLHASSPLKMLPPSPTAIAHGQPPHATSMTVSSTGTVTNINAHASSVIPPQPRYHEVAPPIPPRLAEAGCQTHPEMGISSPRRSGHDVLTPSTATSLYVPGVPGSGHGMIRRGPPSSEDMTVVDGRGRFGGARFGPGDRSDLHPLPAPNKYEYEREHSDYTAVAGLRTARPQVRERRPSVWRRFVRRFSPSYVSVGQT